MRHIIRIVIRNYTKLSWYTSDDVIWASWLRLHTHHLFFVTVTLSILQFVCKYIKLINNDLRKIMKCIDLSSSPTSFSAICSHACLSLSISLVSSFSSNSFIFSKLKRFWQWSFELFQCRIQKTQKSEVLRKKAM